MDLDSANFLNEGKPGLAGFVFLVLEKVVLPTALSQIRHLYIGKVLSDLNLDLAEGISVQTCDSVGKKSLTQHAGCHSFPVKEPFILPTERG